MVNLTRIYTRTGDAGRTRLSDLSETSKTDPRVAAYGHVDEANSILGIVTTQPDLPEEIRTALRHIQNELFDCGADLSNPVAADPPYEPLRIIQANIDRLEAWCDAFGDPLPSLRSFILPGGSQTAAFLHLARSVVRRAERAGWAAVEVYGTEPALGVRPGGVSTGPGLPQPAERPAVHPGAGGGSAAGECCGCRAGSRGTAVARQRAGCERMTERSHL